MIELLPCDPLRPFWAKISHALQSVIKQVDSVPGEFAVKGGSLPVGSSGVFMMMMTMLLLAVTVTASRAAFRSNLDQCGLLFVSLWLAAAVGCLRHHCCLLLVCRILALLRTNVVRNAVPPVERQWG